MRGFESSLPSQYFLENWLHVCKFCTEEVQSPSVSYDQWFAVPESSGSKDCIGDFLCSVKSFLSDLLYPTCVMGSVLSGLRYPTCVI